MPRRDGAWRFHGWHLNFLGLNKTGRCAGGGEDVLFCFHDKSSITQAVLKLNITKNSLEFPILLLQPPECWNSSCVPLGLANGFAGDVAQAPCHTGKPSAHYAPCPVQRTFANGERKTHLFDEADEDDLAAICSNHVSSSSPQLTLSRDPGSPLLLAHAQDMFFHLRILAFTMASAKICIPLNSFCLVTHLITPLDLPRPPCRSSLLSPFSLPWPCCLPLPLTRPLPGLCHLLTVFLLPWKLYFRGYFYPCGIWDHLNKHLLK